MERFYWLFPVSLVATLLLSVPVTAEEQPQELIQQYEQFGHRAVPRDGFPVPTEPKKVSAAVADEELRSHQWVLGVEFSGEAVAYPISVMGIHELVNDRVGGRPIAVCW